MWLSVQTQSTIDTGLTTTIIPIKIRTTIEGKSSKSTTKIRVVSECIFMYQDLSGWSEFKSYMIHCKDQRGHP